MLRTVTPRCCSPGRGPPAEWRSGSSLHEHPPMALDVLGAIEAAVVGALLEAGEQSCPFPRRPVEVRSDVVAVDQDSVDDPGHCGPGLRGCAMGPMERGALVVRTRCRE